MNSATTDYMNATTNSTELCLKNQSTVIEEIDTGKPYFRRISLSVRGWCHGMVADWFLAGRTTERAGRGYHRGIRLLLVGQAIQRAGDLHGRRNTRNLRERLTQLTTNKVSIPYSLLLDRNFVFKNFAQLNTATAPERARCFAISAEYATFAVTYWIHGKCSLFSLSESDSSKDKRIGEHLTASYPYG